MFVSAFSYLWDLLSVVQSKQVLPFSEICAIGGRFSGKSTNIFLFVALAALLPGVKVGVVVCRATKDGGKDVWEDFIQVLENFSIPYKANAYRMTIKVSNSTFKFVGLNSMSKSGAKRSGFPRFANVNYIFRVFEECFEFKEKDKQAIVEAVRHIGEPAKYLDIFICNPWVESN